MTLDTTTVAKLERVFNIESVTSVEDLTGGHYNKIFHIQTSSRAYVLRQYDDLKNSQRITREHALLQFLDRTPFSGYAKLIQSSLQDNPTAVEIEENIYALYEVVPGRNATWRDLELSVTGLANYHRAAIGFTLEPRRPLTHLLWSQELTDLEDLAEKQPEVAAVMTTLRGHVEALEKESVKRQLPTVPCHNDYQFGNILIDGDDVYLIDFEGVRQADRVREFAAAVDLFARDKGSRFHINRLKLISQSYGALTKDEQELFPDYLAALASFYVRNVVRRHTTDKDLTCVVDSTQFIADLQKAMKTAFFLPLRRRDEIVEALR